MPAIGRITGSQRRMLHLVCWRPLFILLAGLISGLVVFSVWGCAPGAPEFKASDLTQATLKNMYPAGGGVPAVTTIYPTTTDELDKLLAAYQSMKPASETGRIVSPGMYLNLKLKGDREIVVVLEKDIPQFVEVREYRGGTLTGTAHLRPGVMFDYMVAKS
jgi:hypothetical protein